MSLVSTNPVSICFCVSFSFLVSSQLFSCLFLLGTPYAWNTVSIDARFTLLRSAAPCVFTTTQTSQKEDRAPVILSRTSLLWLR